MKNPFEFFQLKPAPKLRTTSGTLVDIKTLKTTYLKLQTACHPDSFATASPSYQAAAEKNSAAIASAYKIIADDQQRVKTWLALRGLDIEKQTTTPDMAEFELQMTLNEALAAAKNDHETADRLATKLEELKQTALNELEILADQPQFDAYQTEVLKLYGRLALVSRLGTALRNERLSEN